MFEDPVARHQIQLLRQEVARLSGRTLLNVTPPLRSDNLGDGQVAISFDEQMLPHPPVIVRVVSANVTAGGAFRGLVSIRDNPIKQWTPAPNYYCWIADLANAQTLAVGDRYPAMMAFPAVDRTGGEVNGDFWVSLSARNIKPLNTSAWQKFVANDPWQVWDPESEFATGDFVLWQGETWTSLQGLNVGNEPGEGSAFWRPFVLSDYTPGYAPGQTYAQGNVAVYSAQQWIQTNAAGDPGPPAGPNWTAIGAQDGPVFTQGHAYAAGAWTQEAVWPRFEIRSAARSTGIVAYAVTGQLLNDAFQGLYDDGFDPLAQDWFDDVPADFATLSPCWLVDVTGAGSLPAMSRWLGVYRTYGPAGPFYVCLANGSSGDVENAANWIQVVTDPTNILTYPIVVVSTTTLANGQLTISTPPDFPAQLLIIITDSGSAITAGSITLTDPTQGGTETISVIGTTHTFTTENYYTAAMSAAVSGLTGGSSTTVQIKVYQYAPGVLVSYGGDVWVEIDTTLDAGPPAGPNWTNLGASLTAIADPTNGSAILSSSTYSAGQYGQRPLPIIAIQSGLPGAAGQNGTNGTNGTSPTYCQLIAETSGVWRSLTDDSGESFCFFVPNCQGQIGPCTNPVNPINPINPIIGNGTDPNNNLCNGSVPVYPVLYAHLSWAYVPGGQGVGYHYGEPACVNLPFVSSVTAANGITTTTWSGVATWTGTVGTSTVNWTLTITLTATCDPRGANGFSTVINSEIQYVTTGSVGSQPDPSSAASGGVYFFAGADVLFNGSTSPGSNQALITGSYINKLTVTTTDCAGNLLNVLGPTNPITPVAGTPLLVTNPLAPLTPTTFVMSQTDPLTLSGAFTLPGVPGTITHTVQYIPSAGRYYASTVNSASPGDIAGDYVIVSRTPSFIIGLTKVGPSIAGSPLTITQPAGLTIASASTSTVTASASTALVGSNVTITVTLKDSGGGAIANKLITLSATGASTGGGSTAVTNSSGVATFTVSDSTAQTATYGATDTTDSIAITATASVTYQGVSASASTVTASSSSVSTGTNVTITVTLLTASGIPLPGKTVTLSVTGSSTGGGSTGTTNSSGVATFTVTDSTAQSVTYSAADTTDGVSITQTAGVTYTSAGPTLTSSGTIPAVGSSGSFTVSSTSGMSNGVLLKIVSGSDTWTATITGVSGSTVSYTTNSNTGSAGDAYSSGNAVTVGGNSITVGGPSNVSAAFTVSTFSMSLTASSTTGLAVGTILTIHCVRTSDGATFTTIGTITAISGSSLTLGSITINSPGSNFNSCNGSATANF